MPHRPKSQWIAGGIAAACLLWGALGWGLQLTTVLAGCEDGLGNPGISGRLTWEYCALPGERPLVELPWHADLWLTMLLVASLLLVIAAMLSPRASIRAGALAAIAVPASLMAVLSMGVRLRRRGDGGELFDYFVGHSGGGAARSVPGGWELSASPWQQIAIPDVGLEVLGIGLIGSVAVLTLVLLLARDARGRPV
ncbi:hypothetical protein SacmaDRAFT_5496 [Saccharomonospora marina XMU15]|uniref:Uncharacterized protein n=1 Tax=Saccharomonospora marina XMU15 TaxID=882083 RepID=H5X909_9PSEU|nr:hypothetical protein [Saccharomonospora marina]EHR53612.1 hypothetical protein SacmaDRAFT_5496 [Saccharomonospora marina XMU15]